MTIERYVSEVRAALADVPAREREEALAELESLLRDEAGRHGESRAVAALGSPAGYAASVSAALGEQGGDPLQPQGRLLGMPYDFRGASVERVGARVWNPADPRIFTPRLFGLGWTVNFGALAVKMGLIRPDDLGDEAFERIPKRALDIALAVPVALAVATVVLFAVSWSGLPAEVPVHWGVSGAPDDWAPKALVLGGLAAFAVVPVAMAAARILRGRVDARSRMISSAALAFPVTLALGIGAITVADADGGASGNLTLVVIACAVVLAFLLLYVPSRLGLRAEWREANQEMRRES